MTTLHEFEQQLARNPEYVAAERSLWPYLNLANAVIKARIEAGWTQAELARQTGLTRVTIDNIESALGNPRLATLQALADALGVTLVIEPRRKL